MRRGDDKVYEIVITDKVTKEPVDITGCTLTITWRLTPKSVVFLTKTFTLTDPTNGKATFAIDAIDTSGLDAKREHQYVYDVQVTKTTGKNETVVYGIFTVKPDVTYT